MLTVLSLNLNGIRSAARKGFFNWLATQDIDVICVQEIRAQEAQLECEALFYPEGYCAYFHCAEKKGYSGVGIYTRIKPKNVTRGLGWQTADEEGRYIAIDLGEFWIASLYMPSGTSGDVRQTVKYDFLNRYTEHLVKHIHRSHIICGDFNIAHKPIDLKNWRSNQKNSGFLPEERAWMDELFDGLGYVDTFRSLNNEPDQYTWWSNRGRAWEKNVGWRIDYQVTTPCLKKTATTAHIFKDQRFSDHAPLILQYDI